MNLRVLPAAAATVVALATAVAAVGAPSYADPPDRAEAELTFESTYAPGELCDVAVHELIEGTFRDIEFGDDRDVSHNRVLFTYTNLETGAGVTDRGSFRGTERDGALVTTGLFVQLRGPGGRNLGIAAGRAVLDRGTFETVSRSGLDVSDYAGAVCAGLGAEVAA